MVSQWKTRYIELTDFVKSNPSIKIGSSIVSIPLPVRREFYSIFDSVRKSFIEDNCAGYINLGTKLGIAYAKTDSAIVDKLGLEPVEIYQETQWFLNDPVDGLMRVLFDPLFQLLKGVIDLETFQNESPKLIENAFYNYLREDYLYLVQMALVAALGADKSYRTPVIDDISDNLMGEGHENVGQHTGDVPAPLEVSNISLVQRNVVSFVTPRIIIHSAELSRFIGLHSNFVEPQWTANNVNPNIEWLDFIALRNDYGVTKIRPDIKSPIEFGKILPDILIYSSAEVNNLALVADHKYIMRPDLSIEVMENPSWQQQGKLPVIKQHHSVMRPRLGTYIICLEPAPLDAITVEEYPDIHLINAGFDMEQLNILIDVLRQT